MNNVIFAEDVPEWLRAEWGRWAALLGGLGEWARIEVEVSDAPNGERATMGAIRAYHGMARANVVFNRALENDREGRATILHEMIELLYADVARVVDHVTATVPEKRTRRILDSWLTDAKERFVERLAWGLTADEGGEGSKGRREALADYAHEAWSGWMKYMFSKAEPNDDGTWTMPAWAVERWQRQMSTPYADLPEEEKASDRAEADKMLAIVEGAP